MLALIVGSLHRLAFVGLGALPLSAAVRASRHYFDRRFNPGNPWDYHSAAEQQRLRDLHRTLTRCAPEPACILEIGCAEGTFTELLAQTYPQARIHALDISTTALERAAARVGNVEAVTFEAADLRQWNPPPFLPPVDLVVMTDVLYYLGNARRVASALSTLRPVLSASCVALVAHSAPQAKRLHIAATRGLRLHPVSGVETREAQNRYIVTVLAGPKAQVMHP